MKHYNWFNRFYFTGDGELSLHLSIQRGSLNIVSTLVQAGADIELANMQGFTPLLFAVYLEKIEITR